MSAQATILGRRCGSLGYGLMGLTWRPSPQPFEESIKTMKRALELGADNWNGGEFYGTVEKNSMHLLKEYFTQYPDDADKVIVCIKGGAEKGGMMPIATEENTRRTVDDCLELLQGCSKKVIDIFEFARVDPKRGNAKALSVLADYVKAGKIGGIGLSEVSAKSIRASQKQLVEQEGLKQGVASVEIELSLWAPDTLQNGILAACAELDIPVFAYSPLARGALSGDGVRKNADLADTDFRKSQPKYQDDVLEVNNKITDAVKEVAKRKGATTAQIAIAWVKGQTGRTRTVGLEDGGTKTVKLGTIIPIPGATTVSRVEENFADIVLDESEMKELDELVEKFPTVGDRYGDMTLNNG